MAKGVIVLGAFDDAGVDEIFSSIERYRGGSPAAVGIPTVLEATEFQKPEPEVGRAVAKRLRENRLPR